MWIRKFFLVVCSVAACTPTATHVGYQRVVALTATTTLHTEPVPTGSWQPRLEEVMRVAVGNDPGVVARRLRARAAAETALAEASVPSPELSTQMWNLPFTRPWALGDANMYMVELRQRFPAPGSLGVRAQRGLVEANIALAEVADRERITARRIADVWIDLLESTLHHHVHGQHLSVLEEARQIARVRVSTGGGLGDTTRVELEAARVQRLLVRFTTQQQRATQLINTLTGRPRDAPVTPSSQTDGETIRMEITELLLRASVHRALLTQARGRVERAQSTLQLARIEANRPELMVGVSGWFDPNQHNGVGAMAGMTLPWLWGPGQHRVNAEQASVDAEISSVQEVERDVRIEVIEANARKEGLERELRSLRRTSALAVRRNLDAARAGYVTGSVMLGQWLEAARLVLDTNVDEIELVVELERACVALDQAVGEMLPRTALTDGGAP
jgi:outer membrane protein TolC